MRSKASIKGHPIHVILVMFPVAFLTGTMVLDFVYLASHEDHIASTAVILQEIGMFMGVVASVPGLVDYLYTVPPDSSAKKRASFHAVLNGANLLLFFLAWLIKSQQGHNLYMPVVLETSGFILMCLAGWMGATLVYRNQIGVDARYANAGKWNEARLTADNPGEVEVAHTNELEPNQMKLLHINDKRIVIARTEKDWVAFDDRCPHKGASLAGGSMICGTVQCPWHGSHFKTDTGDLKAGPSKIGIGAYGTFEREGKVFVRLTK